MSAFAVIYERSNTMGSPIIFNRVMERLNHRGPDGSDTVSAGNVTMGHWHFWTTPEEVGERQPLALNGLPFKIVFDGRIDNREELFEKLNIPPAERKSISDAALTLHAYAHWGQDCFSYFVGEFGLVIFDEQENELICARDHLGDRTLFYASYGSQFVIASEPWAVVGASLTIPEINESAVAYYFALKETGDGQTFFNNVYELLPAHNMTITPSSQRHLRYWQPELHKKIRYKTDEEYAEQFRILLEESVRCRLRSSAPVGILMSGGLDSTSVACLASRMIAPRQLTTVSYVFDELPECDERQYINAVKERWNIRSIQIPSDDAWPYKNWKNWRRNPNHPEGNPYRLVKERAYQRANNEGLRVLLTGGFGDHLYDGAEEWMTDLIEEGRLFQALQGLTDNIRYFGLRRALAAPSLRRIARRILDKFPGGKRFHGKQSAAPWLTPLSIDSTNNKSGTLLDPAFALKANLLGLRAAQSCTGEIFNASRHKIELRNPYRDRRLIEFVLALPAYQLYNNGVYKYILRIAMKGILPEFISARRQPTSLLSFYFRGVDREKNLLQDRILNLNAGWRKFVRPDWLIRCWDVSVELDKDGPQVVIPWLCISYEAW